MGRESQRVAETYPGPIISAREDEKEARQLQGRSHRHRRAFHNV